MVKRKTSRRRRGGKLVKTMRKIARQESLRLSETKAVGDVDENQELFHNLPDYYTNMLNITQGVKDPQGNMNEARVGDEIYLKRIQVKFWLSNKADRPNCMYRIILFWYNSNDTVNNNLVFKTAGNKMLDIINTEQISVIGQKYIKSGASYSTGVSSVDGSAKEHSYLFSMGKSYKAHKIIYDENSPHPKKRNIGFAVVAYDAFGTLQSDQIASYAFRYQVFYKDP